MIRLRTLILILATTSLAVTVPLIALDWSAQGGAATTAIAASATATAVTVSSIEQLDRAVKDARDGDVIQLVAGRYPPARLRGLYKAGTVTIRPAPGAEVVMAGLELRDVAGLTLSGLTFRGDPAPGRYQLLVIASERIRLEGLRLEGPAEDGQRAVISSVMLRDVRDVTVTDSHFVGGWHGLSLLSVDGLLVEGNSFRGFETDGIRGGGVNRAVIRRNSLTDFRAAGRDHPDGIQLWSTRQVTAARDIVIEQNLIARGSGTPSQGVFVRDTKLQLPFEGLVIRENMVIGGLYNGITVSGADAPRLERNRVVAFADQDSWLRVSNATGVHLQGNRAFKFVTKDEVALAVDRDNRRWRVMPAGETGRLVREWLVDTGRDLTDADPVLRGLAGGG